MVSSTDSGVLQYCDLPCSSSDYLYANGSCLASCPSPYLIEDDGNVVYCNEPCQPNEYYYSFNDTCLTTCPDPYLTSTFDNTIDLCDQPCNTQDLFYYTSNSSCLTTCDFPYEQLIHSSDPTYDFNRCDAPCDVTHTHIHINGTCLTSCPTIYNTYPENDHQICKPPCLDTPLLPIY